MALTLLKNLSYTSFLTAFLLTTSLNLFKSVETSFNLSTSNLSTLLLKLFEPLDTFSNLSMSSLSISDFKLVKSVFLGNFDVSKPVTLFKSGLVA